MVLCVWRNYSFPQTQMVGEEIVARILNIGSLAASLKHISKDIYLHVPMTPEHLNSREKSTPQK